MKPKQYLEDNANYAIADYLKSIGWKPLVGGFVGIEQTGQNGKLRLIYEFVGAKKKKCHANLGRDMKEHPILFSGPMIRAILEGRKTQTRRILKHPEWYGDLTGDCPHWQQSQCDEAIKQLVIPDCPYGTIGDHLWVRETWCQEYDSLTSKPIDGKALYAATEDREVICDDGDGAPAINKDGTMKSPWKPSIHMPRWASRITLEITDIRVQRLQEITEEDARAEGISDGGCLSCGNHEPCGCNDPNPDARDAFVWLWNSINAKRGFSWESNPWVWAISFKRVQ